MVLVSDHGEEVWEHAAVEMAAGTRGPRGHGHGHTLYAELTRVPLLVVPTGGLDAPRRSARLASVRDVFATLLALAEVPRPAASRSLDLLRLLRDPAPSAWRSWVLSETTLYGPDRAAVTTPELRALRTARRGVLVFDRKNDPGENNPLSPDTPLARRGAALLERTQQPETRTAQPTKADQEALRALGYLE